MGKDAEEKVTVERIMRAIESEMRKRTEKIIYTAAVPGVYIVQLRPDDRERLAPLIPRIIAEMKKKLDEDLERLNRPTLVQRMGERVGQKRLSYERPAKGWQISFPLNTDDELPPGEFNLAVEIELPPRPELGGGNPTKRIVTRHSRTESRKIHESIEAPGRRETEDTSTISPRVSSTGNDVYARITYEDNIRRHVFEMTKNEIVIGRGGIGVWVDIQLETSNKVSREHLRIRRDENTGEFFVRDISSEGTILNDARVPSSLKIVKDTKQDIGVEIPLPAKSRLILAEELVLNFEAVGNP
jgi:hypothetical protein